MEWMAPELLHPSKYDLPNPYPKRPSSDVYSFASVCVEVRNQNMEASFHPNSRSDFHRKVPFPARPVGLLPTPTADCQWRASCTAICERVRRTLLSSRCALGAHAAMLGR